MSDGAEPRAPAAAGGRHASATVSVTVNGEPRELPVAVTVAGLVERLTGVAQGRGVAVAVDGEVVPRRAWPQTRIADGAAVEVVAAVQGG